MAGTRRAADDSSDDQQTTDDQVDAATQAAAEQNAQVEAVQQQLAEAQAQLAEAQAAHAAEVESLNTQLQLAQTVAGKAAQAQFAHADDSEPAEGWDAEKDGYVVLSSVATVRMGKERENSRRFVRGARVPLIKGVNDAQIARLVQLKALAPNDGRVKRATTARVASLAAGAAMDEVAQTPIVAYAPVALPSINEAEAAQARSDASGGSTPESMEEDPNLQPSV